MVAYRRFCSVVLAVNTGEVRHFYQEERHFDLTSASAGRVAYP